MYDGAWCPDRQDAWIGRRVRRVDWKKMKNKEKYIYIIIIPPPHSDSREVLPGDVLHRRTGSNPDGEL